MSRQWTKAEAKRRKQRVIETPAEALSYVIDLLQDALEQLPTAEDMRGFEFELRQLILLEGIRKRAQLLADCGAELIQAYDMIVESGHTWANDVGSCSFSLTL